MARAKTAKKAAARAPAKSAELSKRTLTVKAWLEAKRGAVAEAVPMPRGAAPPALMYKVMGKMFAVLSIRGDEFVILKCDPHLAEMLRAHYSGIGHRSHLDKRFWISVSLDADVSSKEIKTLIAQSYDLVCATLTRKQQAELAALS